MTFILHPFVCSVCKKPRETDANHWYLVYRTTGPNLKHAIVVQKFDDKTARLENVEHVCGREHMQKLVEMWSHDLDTERFSL